MVVSRTAADIVTDLPIDRWAVWSQLRDQSVLFLTRQYIVGCSFQLSPILPFAQNMSVSDERHHAQAGHSGLARIERRKRAVWLLLSRKPSQGATNRHINSPPLTWRKHVGRCGVARSGR